MSRGARLGELPFQRAAHWHHVPPSRLVCGASYVEDLMDTALNTERGRITETEVTTKVGHEGSQKLKFFLLLLFVYFLFVCCCCYFFFFFFFTVMMDEIEDDN